MTPEDMTHFTPQSDGFLHFLVCSVRIEGRYLGFEMIGFHIMDGDKILGNTEMKCINSLAALTETRFNTKTPVSMKAGTDYRWVPFFNYFQ